MPLSVQYNNLNCIFSIARTIAVDDNGDAAISASAAETETTGVLWSADCTWEQCCKPTCDEYRSVPSASGCFGAMTTNAGDSLTWITGCLLSLAERDVAYV